MKGEDAAKHLLEDAMSRHRAGDLAGATSGYESVLAHTPEHFDALHLLGRIAFAVNDAPRAIGLLQRALAVHPDAFPAIDAMATALAAVGRTEDAQAQWRRAIELDPDYAPARESYAQSLSRQGRFAEAAEQFAAVARLCPDSVAAHNNLGAMLWRLERRSEALQEWDRALALDPSHADALLNSAQALEWLGRGVDAIPRMRTLLAQRPPDARPYYHAGLLFHAQGLRDEALLAFAHAIGRGPEHAESRWMQAIAQLQLAYGPDEHPGGDLARFDRAVSELDAWFVGPRVASADRALGTRGPFYVAYHDADNVATLSRYGDLCARLMRECHGEPAIPTPRARSGRRLRLAVVSAYFQDHSVWTALTRGWCLHLDPALFELHLFHTGQREDPETAIARGCAASFRSGLQGTMAWVDALRDLAPDVILYPDACMDTMSARLASLRLASVQVASWGHPQTTGLPTVDYFLSAAAFEPPDGAEHYRERLVCLPNLGCYYDPLAPATVSVADEPLLARSHVPRFLCVGTPYKYLPRDDALLVDIAEQVGPSEFLFFVDMAAMLSQKVEDRLARAFAQRGLDSRQHVRFLPRLSREAFFALMRDADVYLDTIGFSGFNTAMQAVEAGIPVVTCEGRFMRGRFAGGILRTMGLDELVAADRRDYVAKAVQLAYDRSLCESVRHRLNDKKSVIFHDLAPVHAMQEFLLRAAAD